MSGGPPLIELRGLELHGFHGVLDEERRAGQRFLFDVELEVGEEAARTDRIEDAVDYRDVAAAVREVSDGRAYHCSRRSPPQSPSAARAVPGLARSARARAKAGRPARPAGRMVGRHRGAAASLIVAL